MYMYMIQYIYGTRNDCSRYFSPNLSTMCRLIIVDARRVRTALQLNSRTKEGVLSYILYSNSHAATSLRWPIHSVMYIGGSEKADVRDILRFYQFYKLKVG